jgi:hypothetical protein
MAVTSNSIPAEEELYGLNTLGGSVTSAGASTSNVIFDLDLSQDELHQIQAGVTYAPTVYRYAKLRGGPIYNMDFQVWLRKQDGTFTPWIVDTGGSISLKFMFTKVPY